MKAQKAAGGMIVGVLTGAAVLGSMKGLEQVIRADEQTAVTAISAETVVADENGMFTATVFLDKLPDTGISAVDFAVAYDTAVLSIGDVELLYDTGADDAEAKVNPDLAGTVFTYEDTEGELRIRWATALVNTDYWLKEERAFFTISGTVHEDVPPGGYSALRIVPAGRETYEGSGEINTVIVAGYLDANGNPVNCETELTDGAVWKPLDETGATMYGDINLDGQRTVADAILLHRAIAEEITLHAAAYANADCEFDGVLTIADVTRILQALEDENEAAALGAH